MVGIQVDDQHYEGLLESVSENAQALTDERTSHSSTTKQLSDYKHRVDEARQALAAEQKEHGITAMQRGVLQTQCEDMQREMEAERKINNASPKPSVGVDNQAIVDIVVEKDDKISILMQRVAHADERLETANAMATTYADANASLKRELATTTQRLDNSLKVTDEMVDTDMKDEMACMAEEVIGLKADIADLQGAVESANELRDSYKRTGLTLSDERAKLMQEIHTLNDSAETQSMHMQDVDAACKRAEETVMAQRKEIEELKSGEDMYICPSVDTCNPMHKCGHREPHMHKDAGGCCNYRCRLATGICVKVDTCKECATLREEIINRDAVILQQESRAEDREEIIRALAKEIKLLREPQTQHTGFGIMLSGKAGEMKKTAQQRQCKYYTQCEYATSSHDTCENGGGKYCGVWRHNEATQ